MKRKQKFHVVVIVETESDKTLTEAKIRRILQGLVNPDAMPDEVSQVRLAEVIDVTK